MLRLLRFLWTGDWHVHRWQDIRVAKVDGGNDNTYTRYYCRCEVCGTHKTFN